MTTNPPSGGDGYGADDFESRYQQAPDLPSGLGDRSGPIPAASPIPDPPKRSLPWGAIIKYGGIALVVLGVWFFGRGTTSAERLDVGDCFEMPEDGSFERVSDQDCAEPHEAQIFAELDDGAANDMEAATEECFGLLLANFNDAVDEMPDFPPDFSIAIITDENGRDATCVASSESGGLVGSLVPES